MLDIKSPFLRCRDPQYKLLSIIAPAAIKTSPYPLVGWIERPNGSVEAQTWNENGRVYSNDMDDPVDLTTETLEPGTPIWVRDAGEHSWKPRVFLRFHDAKVQTADTILDGNVEYQYCSWDEYKLWGELP